MTRITIKRGTIEYHVIRDLAKVARVDYEGVNLNSSLIEDLRIDSLGFLDYLLAVERRFDLGLKQKDALKRLYSDISDPKVVDVVNYIEEILRGE